MHLRTAFGPVALSVWHGKNPAEGRWGCPIRERWGLTPHQQLSPALEDKLAYFATVTGSYAAAAKLAAKVGCPVEDSTIQILVQRLGAKAEAQTQARLEQTPLEKPPARAPTPLAVLMIDGFQVRFRGPGWGKKKTGQPRVEWHESKLGVFYRHERPGERGGNCWRKSRSAGRAKGWSWGGGCTGKPSVADWAGPKRYWRWQTARRGFGTLWPIAGVRRISYWTSTMPANISGAWARRCIPKTKPPDGLGWKGDYTACGTAKKKRCCGKSRRYLGAEARRGKRSGGKRTILRNTPDA
jgi:hypothetical protein